MENKQSPSKNKIISIQEEKLIREIDYDSLARGSARLPKKQLLLDLEILQKRSKPHPVTQRVLVSIRPKAPVIKTLYIAEKCRFNLKKGSDKSGSLLAIGDHSSSTTQFNEDLTNIVNSIACGTRQGYIASDLDTERLSSIINQVESSTVNTQASDTYRQADEGCNIIKRSAEKCFLCTQTPLYRNLPILEARPDKKVNNKVDIATLIVTNTSSESSTRSSVTVINTLKNIIQHLERKFLRQEMVLHALDPNIKSSSSDEDSKLNMTTASEVVRAGCSYIQQYSHVPETSAFQRYAQQTSPLSSLKVTTLEKEHNSEQYGRDFTAYDGITARGRRQCASVPCKRDDVPKMAAERVHKIRHKLNPVRDYRLMDTVHYLAQGEFAPRDDGIKLTPSREAVLSDIIWEDVCRTHWPNTRLGRRMGHPERHNARCELQRLIDSLLRERVAHVERRRRRHYRIVKLNHRHESCRPVGKTGDIIVASHKNRQGDEVVINEHIGTSAVTLERKRQENCSRKSARNHDCVDSDTRHNRQFQGHNNFNEDCVPGPSYAVNRSPPAREATCCYQATNHGSPKEHEKLSRNRHNRSQELMSGSSSFYKPKAPRLLIKKEGSHRRYHNRDEPNLEHYILLPTLVERTPSNLKRQKKFNELYRRILNVQLNNDKNVHNCDVGSESLPINLLRNPSTKDVGLNINVTLSASAEYIPDNI